MAWTSAWPKTGCEDLTTTLANELVDELNLRLSRSASPTQHAHFTADVSTWNLIFDYFWKWLEVDVTYFVNPATGYRYTILAGYPWETIQYPARDGIFPVVFGEGAIGFTYDELGTRKVLWYTDPYGQKTYNTPPDCSEPWVFWINEIHDMIDALKWVVVPWNGLGFVSQYRACWSEASKQLALDVAWAAEISENSGYGITQAHFYAEYWKAGSVYGCTIKNIRLHLEADLPAYAEAGKVFFHRLDNNNIDTTGPCPEWELELWNSDTDPEYEEGQFAWEHGALAATISVPDMFAPPTHLGSWGADLDIVAGEKNYLQIRHNEDETKPQFLVDEGDWLNDSVGSTKFHYYRQTFGVNVVNYLTLAIKVVPDA